MATPRSFSDEFLEKYLMFGKGSMPKGDIDALVMYFLDRHGVDGAGPLAHLSNQAAIEKLRTPVVRVKKLRYEAALKLGDNIEDQAKGRLLAALSNAALEPKGNRVCLVIEDTLAKSWLQGKLKEHRQIFEHSFNSEIIKVPADGLFVVLDALFDHQQTKAFRDTYKKSQQIQDAAKRSQAFRDMARSVAEGAAQAAGGVVATILKLQLGLPH
jgi:hypothetical protein